MAEGESGTVLCLVDAMPDPGAKGPFKVGGKTVFVVRSAGKVYAYEDSCPHAFVPLEMEPDRFLDLTGTYLLCTMHGAHFDIATGACVAGPCKGRRLTAYPIGIHNGKVIAAPSPDGV